MGVVLADHIQMRVFRLEGTLRHQGQVGGGLRVVTPLLDLVLGYLKDTQVLSQVLHSKGVFGRQVLNLLHGEESRVQFGEHLSELYVIKLLYIRSTRKIRYLLLLIGHT